VFCVVCFFGIVFTVQFQYCCILFVFCSVFSSMNQREWHWLCWCVIKNLLTHSNGARGSWPPHTLSYPAVSGNSFYSTYSVCLVVPHSVLWELHVACVDRLKSHTVTDETEESNYAHCPAHATSDFECKNCCNLCGAFLQYFEYCRLGLLTCKNRLSYNLYCVGGDIKHCTI